MRFFHTADLHLGKKIYEQSMLEEQYHILQQILALAKEYRPDALLITGDVYDKPSPPADAISLLDDFLTACCEEALPVLLIAGNHDSPERLSFGGRIMAKHQVIPQGIFNGKPGIWQFQDDYGTVEFILLPFIKPAQARPFFPHKSIEDYSQAVAAALETLPANDYRRVLLAHQFVTGDGDSPQRSDSETINVGGLDEVNAAVLAAFDYVALGHLHRPQSVSRPQIRYAGSPLKYSFSETDHEKSLVMVDLAAKGQTNIQCLPLTPSRDLRQLKGPLQALMQAPLNATERMDYIRVILTERPEHGDPLALLRSRYPNLLRLDFPALTEETDMLPEEDLDEELRDPVALFNSFYLLQHGQPLSQEQKNLFHKILQQVEEHD